MGKYYIKLIAQKNFCREWSYETLEQRNEVYYKLKEKFRDKKSSEVPYIEIELGINENISSPTINMPLRLQAEAKDEVIKYMDS